MPNVVFVPGLPGSELFERDSSRPGSLGKRWFVPRPFTKLVNPSGDLRAALCGPDDLALLSPDPVIAGQPIESVAFDVLPFSFDLTKQAASLYQILDERCGVSGAQLAKVGWDWRRPVTDFANADGASARVEAAIRSFPRSTVIVHSTGALVVRRLFDRILQAGPAVAGPFFARIERVVAFGGAWAGTPKALKGLVGQQGFGVTPAAKTQEMLASSWAAHDLVPRAAASQVYDHAGVVLDPTSNTAASRLWVGPTGLAAKIGPRLDHSRSNAGNGVPAQSWNAPVELWNVCGWGEETDVAARVNADGSVDFNATTPASLLEAKSPWAGQAAWEGDGTVPLASAAWIRDGGAGAMRTIFVPIGGYADSTQSHRVHSSLWSNPASIAILEHVLGGAPLPFVASAAVDWSDRVDPGVAEPRIRFAMQAPDGSALQGGVLRVLNLTGAPDVPVRADGRGLLRVRRSHLPLTAGGRFRRLETELRHASLPQPLFQRLFLEP